MNNLNNIKYWLFDLDNTLYDGATKVFEQVDKKMTKFISEKLNVDKEEARKIQKNYFQEYNTTLNGMIKHHKIDADEFLEFVHDVDLNFLNKDEALQDEIKKLEGKKIIFTNGSRAQAENVTKRIGIDKLFDGIFDIVDAEYHPKPEAKAFDLMIEKFKIDPKETLYIEDIAKNLSIGKDRGTITAWLINDEEWGKKESDKEYIDYKIENLTLFLKEIRLLKNQ